MTKLADFDKLEEALALLQPQAMAPVGSKDEDDDEGGSVGGGGGIIIEKTLFAEMFGLQRANEKQFGPVGDFDAMAFVAEARLVEQQSKAQAAEQGKKSSLKSHPVLGKLSKFDGDDPKMSMNPETNDKAQERNEHRNELKMGLKNSPSSAPKPKPGGM